MFAGQVCGIPSTSWFNLFRACPSGVPKALLGSTSSPAISDGFHPTSKQYQFGAAAYTLSTLRLLVLSALLSALLLEQSRCSIAIGFTLFI